MKKLPKFIGISALIGLTAGSVWFVLNSQSIFDWWTLRNYQPSPQIQKLADDASLNDESRKLFYVNDPQLLDKENFRGKCSIGEETIVLGCYISNDGIYVFDVSDERLEGVEEVTAAHEMLHVVYDRMSQSEKEKIDKLVLDYYQTLNDPRLNESIENYRKRDPNIIGNELHSIFGTEYADLPAELEAHYSKYFVDRQTVVMKSLKYAQEFEKREAQIQEYDKQLAALNSTIEELQTNLELQNSALQVEYNELQSMRGNTDAYNQAVPAYNQNVNQFNRQLEELTMLIERYNKFVKERNAIAVEEQELVEAIDTRLSEIE